MQLTDLDKAMLQGDHGEGVALAMRMLVAIGKAMGADALCDVSRSHVALSNQDADTWFAEKLVAGGAVCRVPPTVNPGFDLEVFGDVPGLGPDDVHTMERSQAAYRSLGARLTYTCTPYVDVNVPQFGEVTAFSESSAIVFVNSVFGARTNRESVQSSLSAAVTGRVPRYGLLLDENRKGSVHVHVEAELKTEFDYHLLGYAVPRLTGIHTAFVPVFTGIPGDVKHESQTSLGAGLNTDGNVALYHIVGVTPESPTLDAAFHGRPPDDTMVVKQSDIADQLEILSADKGPIDFVLIGCPHLSFDQLGAIAARIANRRFKTEFWVMTSFTARELGLRSGIVQRVEQAGGHVVADTCIDQVCWKNLAGRRGATNSPKGAYYASRRSMAFALRNLDECVDAAVEGRVR